MEKTLNEVEVGEVGTIVRVAGTGIIRRRLFDMGITPGALEKKLHLVIQSKLQFVVTS